MTDIKTLLPQKDPFLFVDKIISATPEEIVGVKTYDSDFIEMDATITLTVKNLKISQTTLKQTGVAFYQDKAILEATWLGLRLPN